MECPNCNFQNVPGLLGCARCQSVLDFSSVSIDPPRAADAALPLPVRDAMARAGIAFRDSYSSVRREARTVLNPDINWGSLVRSVIPGWGHYRLGYRKFAWMFLGVWLTLLVLTLLLQGGEGGWPVYFMLVGWHGLVISLILAKPLQHQPVLRRACVGLLAYLFLNFCLYLPAGWLITGVFVPFTATGISNSNTLRDGDTVIHSGRWNRPDAFTPGDLVVYEIRPVIVAGAYIRGGMGIDRIVAGPGDSVSYSGSTFSVNQFQIDASRAPLRHLPWVRPFTVTLSADEYFVAPSLFNAQGQQTPNFGDAFVRASVVHTDQITGKVLWRSRPWSRFGSLSHASGADAQSGEARP